MPSKTRLSNILQITYGVGECDSENIIEIKSVNFYEPDKLYLWHYFLVSYKSHLMRIFYRLSLLSYFCQALGGPPDETKDVKRHPGNLDSQLDKVWAECLEAMNDERMDSSWRSIVFDRWLTVEYHVRRHDRMHIENYIESEGTDWLNVGIMSLGKSCLCLICVDLITTLDRLG